MAEDKHSLKNYNDVISFKHMSYSVVENAGFVVVTLEKHVQEDVSVWVRTC